MTNIVLLVFVLVAAFMPVTVKAENVPAIVVEQCRKAVARQNPVRITYNYGELIFDSTKSIAEISRSCGNNAAGCFKSLEKGCASTLQTKNIKINGYNCLYTVAEVICDFSGAHLDINGEYKGCNARAVLRHELQHFMNWKTAKENLVRELKEKLTTFVINNITVCKDDCQHNIAYGFSKYKQKIENKWYLLKQANDYILDEVDHDYANQVNYTVCAPYSLEFGLN